MMNRKHFLLLFIFILSNLVLLSQANSEVATNSSARVEQIQNINQLLATIEARIYEAITEEENQTALLKQHLDTELESLLNKVENANDTVTSKKENAAEQKRIWKDAEEEVQDAQDNLNRLIDEHNLMKQDHNLQKEQLQETLSHRTSHLEAEIELIQSLRIKLDQLLNNKVQNHNQHCDGKNYRCSSGYECRFDENQCKYPSYHDCENDDQCVSGHCSPTYTCLPKSCADIYTHLIASDEPQNITNGEYIIFLPSSDTGVPVYCDMESDGYTLVVAGIEGQTEGYVTQNSVNIQSAATKSETFKFNDADINTIRSSNGIYRMESLDPVNKVRYTSHQCIYDSLSTSDKCRETWKDEALQQHHRQGDEIENHWGISDSQVAGRGYYDGFFSTSIPEKGWIGGHIYGREFHAHYGSPGFGGRGIETVSIFIWVK